uniref:Maturase K n=1 Tax=Romanomermis culicivorax TaxID=13658 RepID=A0A915K334_ROMCU
YAKSSNLHVTHTVSDEDILTIILLFDQQKILKKAACPSHYSFLSMGRVIAPFYLFASIAAQPKPSNSWCTSDRIRPIRNKLSDCLNSIYRKTAGDIRILFALLESSAQGESLRNRVK